MTQESIPAKTVAHLPTTGAGQIAPLANIGVMEQALQRLSARSISDPGMIVVSGPSGYGKSVAAAWAKARHRAYYLQLDDFVTKKSMLLAMCRALGLETNGQAPRGTCASASTYSDGTTLPARASSSSRFPSTMTSAVATVFEESTRGTGAMSVRGASVLAWRTPKMVARAVTPRAL